MPATRVTAFATTEEESLLQAGFWILGMALVIELTGFVVILFCLLFLS